MVKRSSSPVYCDETGFFVEGSNGNRFESGPHNRKGRRPLKIHLIEKSNHFVKLQDNIWESGWWSVDEETARQLIGGDVYFHKKRGEPSFYGGKILGCRIEKEGQHEGQTVFKLEHSPACRNVSTDKAGWIKDVKITDVKEEAP
jgi:hypothetical protein